MAPAAEGASLFTARIFPLQTQNKICFTVRAVSSAPLQSNNHDTLKNKLLLLGASLEKKKHI
jgi:hypothetical protein